MSSPVDALCLKCGLCCNGVLFLDVRREGADRSPLFDQHGPRVSQPCPAFNAHDCTCAIYAGRPARCRKFECKQLLAVQGREVTVEAALRKIAEVRRLAKKIDRLLSALGFDDQSLPLNKRFQRCQKAAERGEIDAKDLDRLAELQLSMHRMNGLLARYFYA